ncbi:MAG: class I SAM-dependent methyltransferase [Acidobacteriia bacterium]|nr:class I SAM-dependent methyltransferase [Terriglobia bacterium]
MREISEKRPVPSDAALPVSCLVCGLKDFEIILQKNDFEIFRCRQCGFGSVAPMPDDDFLLRFYEQQEYFQSDGVFGYSDYESKREFYLGLFRDHLRILNGHSEPGRLLDLGCGKGDFLSLAREAGWEVCGVEISDSCRREAERRAGVPVYSSPRYLSDKREFFDVITMWEVIEHLPHPDRVLSEVLPLLRAGGLLAMTTPNTRNLTALRSPARWSEYKPPEHLLYFNFDTIHQYLSERFNLQVLEVKGIHRDLRLASSGWVEAILDWASRLRLRHETRFDPRWWVYAMLVRMFKEAPRRMSMALGTLDPRLVDTGIFVLARK